MTIKEEVPEVAAAVRILNPPGVKQYFCEWLEGCAYKVSMGWTVFALAGLVALAIASMTISFFVRGNSHSQGGSNIQVSPVRIFTGRIGFCTTLFLLLLDKEIPGFSACEIGSGGFSDMGGFLRRWISFVFLSDRDLGVFRRSGFLLGFSTYIRQNRRVKVPVGMAFIFRSGPVICM